MQDVDNRIAKLTREIAALPKHIAEIEKKLTAHERKLEADRAALTGNQKDRKKLDGDIQAANDKISKLRGQMLDAKTNEQYRAFQSEIEFCEKEIRRAEDRILELMTESEPLDQNVKGAEQVLKTQRAHVESEKQQAHERSASDKQALDALQTERKAIIAELNPNVYKQYERVRKMRRGIGVAEAADGTCTACHMTMRLQFFQDLKRGDQIMACESCGRIMYYNPPAPVEDTEAAPVSQE